MKNSERIMVTGGGVGGLTGRLALLQRRHATRAGGGDRPVGCFVLLVQAATLSLAFLCGLVEATGVLGGETLAFKVLDLSWPLSMLWMLVGVTVVAAKRLAGWRRFVPVLCVPVGLAGMGLGTLLLRPSRRL